MEDRDVATPIQVKDYQPVNIGDWIWRRMCAKVWWSAILFYWVGMILSLRVDALAIFYHSAFAGLANIFFFPPLVMLILSFGYINARIGQIDFDETVYPEVDFQQDRDWYGPSGVLREFDPLDPSSGALWIGNPLNPLNGAYINRHSS
ncbi:hypothetical protein [Sphingobium yanoikuyae]|nr:hypothetical protein [Sphingobium yanoikuyae]